MQLTLTKIGRYTQDKNGKPLTYKTQQGVVKPYTRLSLKCREYGDKFLSGFGAPWNENWKEGDVVECDVEEKPGTDKDGKAVTYLNISKPDPVSELGKAVFRHEQELLKIWNAIKEVQATLKAKKEVNIPIIEGEDALEFDESGAPIFTEPDLKDLPFD